MSEVERQVMSRAEAERLTERIRHTAASFMEARDRLAELVREAQEGRAHVALGYRSWTEYVAAVCSDTPLMRLTRDERKVIVADLAGQGMSTRAIAPVVGVSQRTVARQVGTGESNDSPATPAVPTFDPAPAWDPTSVDHDTGEIQTDAPTARAVTGIDGKTYTRPEPKETPETSKPRRRPIADQFFDAAYDAGKAIERLERLVGDDRLAKNKKQIALAHKNDLLRLADVLSHVLRELD